MGNASIGMRERRGNPDKASLISVGNLLFGIAGTLLFLSSFTFSVPVNLLCIVLLLMTCMNTYKVRKNRMLLYVFIIILYANYSVCFANHLSHIDTYFASWSDRPEAYEGIRILLLFQSILTLFLPKDIAGCGYGDEWFTRQKTNSIVIIALMLVLAMLLRFGYTRPEVIGQSRGYYSPLYEYSIVLFIVGYYIAGKSSFANLFLDILLFLFAAQNLLYGGRVTAFQLLTVWLFVRVSPRVRNYQIVIMGLALFVLFSWIGSSREGWVASGLRGVSRAIDTVVKNGFAWDTAYSAWFTSLTFIAFFASASSQLRLGFFLRWLASIVLGSSRVANSSLPNITRVQYVHYGGGFLPVYFYSYLGYIGVVLIALFVVFMLRTINASCDRTDGKKGKGSAFMASICSLYIVATASRWYLYSPSQLTRGLLLCLLVSSVLLFIDDMVQRRRR